MNVKTFIACAKLICESDSPRSILIQGPHGIGKSSLARLLSRTIVAKSTGKNLHLIDKRLAQLTEGDIIGLPLMDKESGVTKWLPPDWIKKACDEPCLLFLDEGNRGTGEVLQASFQLVLDRCIGENRLHPETRVFMAINNDTRLYNVEDLDPAYRDRFWQADLMPSVDEWVEWGSTTGPEGGNIHPIVLSFIKGSPTSLFSSDAVSKDEKQPSPRTWEGFNVAARCGGFFDTSWKELSDEQQTVFTMLTMGFVGRDVGNAFINFYKTLEAAVSAENVLNDWKKHSKRVSEMTQGEWIGVIDRLVAWMKVPGNILSQDQVKNFGEFLKVLPGELVMSLWMSVAKESQTTLENVKIMNPYISPIIVATVKAGVTVPAQTK
jgi:energy-coupling factor transporter ATP-binding protein EcfA2